MATITLRTLRRRSGVMNLKSDLFIKFYSWDGLRCVRTAERSTERRYPVHRILRMAAQAYFGKRGYDIYPNGVAPSLARTCADFALLPGRTMADNRITFVECLSAHFVERATIRKKSELAIYGDLVFVIEDRPASEFNNTSAWKRYVTATRILAKRFPTYWCRCDVTQGTLRRVTPAPRRNWS